MSTIIRMNTESLMSNKATLTNYIQELDQYNTELTSLIEQIKASWSGQKSENYYNMMLSYKNQTEKMVTVLTEFESYVDAAVKKFEALDNQSATRIRNSF